MLRTNVIMAVFKRNVLSYFSGVIGYLFIIVFVVAGATLAFRPEFFSNNSATLDQLNEYFPHLLLFIIPAITMGTWADEKKLGTDELLFTLPARDVEILLGKYFAVLAVYTIALLFSLTHLIVLAIYADPDWGLLFSTYFGYWISGAALLSAGMFASVLTSSATVAFVLGTLFCAVPVFIGQFTPVVSWIVEGFGGEVSSNNFLQELSLAEQFREFGLGLIPLSNVLYFLSLTVFMLYLNLVFITKRHWGSAHDKSMGFQFLVRAICLAAVLVSLNVIAVESGAIVALRLDLTDERVFTLSETTEDILKQIKEDQPITIQAFLSPEVPRELVHHRRRLNGMLRQYDRMGGSKVTVRFVEVEPFSEEAEEAKNFGIQSRSMPTQRGGRAVIDDVFLGAVISSPYDEVVVPFFEVGIPVEYELTRSIRTVSQEDRLTVGILRTDAKVMGGFDMSSFRSSPEWQIVQELRKQYKVEEVSPDTAIEQGEFDVLIAVLPSSLTQPQMTNFVDYVKTGSPVLIFDDPLPVFGGGQGLQMAPRLPKPRQGGMFGQGPPPEQKADGGRASTLLNALEIAWDNGEIVWDATGQRIHPEFENLITFELVFVSPKGGTRSAFNLDSEITSGLQELLARFPGAIRPRSGSALKFEALLRTSPISGILEWDEVTRPGMFGGVTIVQNPFLGNPDKEAHVLAAHISSKKKEKGQGINSIFVADTDVISDEIFSIVQGELYELKLDNVTFVLNAVDALAGDEAYLALRKRRAKHRTLTEVEKQAERYRNERRDKEAAAEKLEKTKLDAAQERFDKQRAAIEDDTSLTPIEKEQKLRIAQEVEQRRLDVDQAAIKREKQEEIEQIKATEQREIRALERRIWLRAVAIPPIPAIVLGIIVFCMRINLERREIKPERMRK